MDGPLCFFNNLALCKFCNAKSPLTQLHMKLRESMQLLNIVRYYVAHIMGCNRWLTELLIKFKYSEKATKIWWDFPLSFDIIK